MKNRIFLLLFLAAIGAHGQRTFVHPGVLHTQASLDRIKDVVQNKILPGYGSYSLLAAHPCSSSSYQLKGPFETISRDGEFSYTKSKMEMDFSAAYLNTLMWMVTGDKDHAKKAIQVLEAYAAVLKKIPPTNDAPLLAGLEGSKIINAMELLQHSNSGIKKEQVLKINKMITEIFLPVCDGFYQTRAYTNGNWGAIVTRMYIGAAIYFNNEKMYSKAIDFYNHGDDNGTIKNYINDTGQIQESGRDQGHSQLGLGALASICEIAWNQGDDLYQALDNRLLKGFEYVARYNLGNDDVPFVVWKDVTGKYSSWTKISDISRGKFIPVYEMVYNHYVERRGLSMPFTKQVINKIRPEGYDRDQPAFGTLLFHNSAHK